MLAARDQENLVHSHQTAAAAKPLNQNIRSFAPKTPGNKVPKTPFRIPLNDENNPLTFGGLGKQSVAGPRFQTQKENVIRRTGKDGEGEKGAFATPMGPRNRAPLGMKTTNAKAFQTPAPQLGTNKPARTGKRSSTVRKLKQSAPKQGNTQKTSRNVQDEEIPDIEYMPPTPQPLPDPPEDIPYDNSFPQFKGRNFARGWTRLYNDEYDIGEDGLTKKEREWREEQEAFDKRFDDLILQQVREMESLNIKEFPDEPCIEELEAKRLKGLEKKKANKPNINRHVSTLQSRSAAKALSRLPRPVAHPKTRPAPTARPRVITGLTSKRKSTVPSNPSSMRHTAAVVTSRTTLGYAKGRGVSSALRGRASKEEVKKVSSTKSIISPDKYMELYGPPPFGTEMWLRCKTAGLFDTEDVDQAILDEIPPSFYQEDEETANFQLTL
ncbi:hypothetical protein D8B26_008258 [Coccidioides posadasii str. Silveira]|uniref:Uncharacterized protein n=2 Tax=Coccidioides posadasii TaxID=199306 RepID=E9DGP0_COCPS|nr:hypothetical protein CPC735_043770 [Coccidioides posadasii C735 delta SOWgp]EER25933.1 hypothetical protein CPC735_043770 [Coccidioides posadasii C735 delta SOWgp]EFW14401.1 conserved hypothetical protein [Coccidioides posadasii str. Silveira]QVM13650.1 hypothetical protein D8B26_008258 [Coccidioides posadasii str. Silveira]|eukprot:XP_003068078.1 hypothetical protein CPC735_043770 [Coccidioides posadasii C735 delta SOWgp]